MPRRQAIDFTFTYTTDEEPEAQSIIRIVCEGGERLSSAEQRAEAAGTRTWCAHLLGRMGNSTDGEAMTLADIHEILEQNHGLDAHNFLLGLARAYRAGGVELAELWLTLRRGPLCEHVGALLNEDLASITLRHEQVMGPDGVISLRDTAREIQLNEELLAALKLEAQTLEITRCCRRCGRELHRRNHNSWCLQCGDQRAVLGDSWRC